MSRVSRCVLRTFTCRLLLILLAACSGEFGGAVDAAAPATGTAEGSLARVEIPDRTGFDVDLVAARIGIPAGWTSRGGMVWDHGAGCFANMLYQAWSASDPSGRSRVQVLPGRGWNPGTTPGAAGGCTSAPWQSLREYLVVVAEEQVPDARILGWRERADLAAEAAERAAATGSVEATEFSGGELDLAWTEHGTEMRGRLEAVLQRLRGNGGDLASVSAVTLYRAPATDFAEDLLDRMRASLEPDPRWQELAGRQVEENFLRWLRVEGYAPAAAASPAPEGVDAEPAPRARRPAQHAPFVIHGSGDWAESLALALEGSSLPEFWFGEITVPEACADEHCLHWRAESADGRRRLERLPAESFALGEAGGPGEPVALHADFRARAEELRERLLPAGATPVAVPDASANDPVAPIIEFVAPASPDAAGPERRLRVALVRGPVLPVLLPESGSLGGFRDTGRLLVATLYEGPAGIEAVWPPRDSASGLQLAGVRMDRELETCLSHARRRYMMMYIGADEDARREEAECWRAHEARQRGRRRFGLPMARG